MQSGKGGQRVTSMSKKPRKRSNADIATELFHELGRLPGVGSCSDGSPRRYLLSGDIRDRLIELLEGMARDPFDDRRPAHRPSAELVKKVMRYLEDDAELCRELPKHRTREHALKAVANRKGIDSRSFDRRLRRGQEHEAELHRQWDAEAKATKAAKVP
jgi:hypothetical protein